MKENEVREALEHAADIDMSRARHEAKRKQGQPNASVGILIVHTKKGTVELYYDRSQRTYSLRGGFEHQTLFTGRKSQMAKYLMEHIYTVVLECPFCGSENAKVQSVEFLGNWHSVLCDECNAFGPDADTLFGAVKAWTSVVRREETE